jgi:hypothetical protein
MVDSGPPPGVDQAVVNGLRYKTSVQYEQMGAKPQKTPKLRCGKQQTW